MKMEGDKDFGTLAQLGPSKRRELNRVVASGQVHLLIKGIAAAHGQGLGFVQSGFGGHSPTHPCTSLKQMDESPPSRATENGVFPLRRTGKICC